MQPTGLSEQIANLRLREMTFFFASKRGNIQGTRTDLGRLLSVECANDKPASQSETRRYDFPDK